MTSVSQMNLYEGLFLFNIQQIGGDLDAALTELKEVLGRAEAEVVTLGRWDERKLAYPIGNQKRGLYLLTYFRARGSQIANIERDVNLSENMLRAMIIKADHIGEAEMEAIQRDAELSATEAALRAQSGGEDDSDTSDTVEGSRAESESAASEDGDRPTGDEGQSTGDAPESGQKDNA